VSRAKTAEPIEMPFGWVTLAGTRNVLDGGRDSLHEGAILGAVRAVRPIAKHAILQV